MKREIQGHQPTDKLDTTNPPRGNEFILSNVINRRELLIAFGRNIQKKYGVFLSEKHLEQEVDSFESNL